MLGKVGNLGFGFPFLSSNHHNRGRRDGLGGGLHLPAIEALFTGSTAAQNPEVPACGAICQCGSAKITATHSGLASISVWVPPYSGQWASPLFGSSFSSQP